MSKIEAVILDWAGTTVDYGCFAPVQAFVESFQAYGMKPTMDEIRKPMGMLKRDHIKTVLSMPTVTAQFKEVYQRDFTEADIDSINGQFENKLLSILHLFAQPKPYVLETVNILREKGIKIGSTTGYTDEMMAIVVPKAKELGYSPDAWYTPDAVGKKGRPHPDMVFKNLEKLAVTSAENAMKVGDTISDILEGKNAGLLTIGIVEGSSEMGLSMEEYEALSEDDRIRLSDQVTRRYLEAGADYVVQDIRGILNYLG